MAVTNSDLLIKIAADSSSAVKGLGEVEGQLKSIKGSLDQTSESAKKTSQATTDLGASALKLDAAISIAQKAFSAFQGILNSTVGEYINAEKATEKLRGTLRLVGGQDVDKAVEGFSDFADQLQGTTNIASETVLQYVTMGKALRLTDEQTKSFVTTAADLAAVQGGELGESFNALIASLKGESKALLKLAPELKGLTEEQFRAGAANDVLAKKFKGFAEQATKNIGGQLTQVTLRYGDVLEEIGGVFQDVFRFDDQRLAIAAFSAIKDAVEQIRPAAKELGENIGAVVDRMVNGFGNVSDKATALTAAIGVLGTALALAFAPQIIAAVVGFSTTLGLAVGAATVLAAKIAVVTGAVAAFAGGIEIIIRNFSQLDKVGIVVINGLILGFRKAKDFIVDVAGQILEAFINVAKNVGELFSLENLKSAFTGEGPGIFESIAAGAKKAFGQIGKDSAVLSSELKSALGDLDLGFTGKAITAGKEFADGFSADIGKVEKAQISLTQATNDYQSKTLPAVAKSGSDAFSKLMDATRKLEEETAKIGATSVTSLSQVRTARLAEIKTVEDELTKTGQLTGKTEDLARARAAVDAAFKAGFGDVQTKELKDIIKANDDLAASLEANGKTQVEQIDMRLARELELLNVKREQLKADGLLSPDVAKGLDRQEGLKKQQADVAKQAAPPQALEALSKGGEAIGASITSAFAPMLGAVNAVSAVVSAVNAVLDAIPNMLNSIGQLFSKIAELPLVVLRSLSTAFDSILKSIGDIIPNLAKAIPGIISAAISFLSRLPTVILDALRQLPRLLLSVLDDLPALAEDFVNGIIAAIPSIALGLIEFLIKDGPRIAIKIAEVLAIRLPIAIIRGIGGALSSISKMIQALFKGGLKFDVKDAQKKLTDVAKKFAGSASRIFEVKDLVEGAKSSELAKGLAANIDGASKRAKSLMEKAWGVLEKIGGALAELWKGVWGILQDIGGALAEAWKAVWEFLKDVGGFLAELWKGVWGFLQTIGLALAQLWQGVWRLLLEIGHAVGRLFMAAWEALQKVGGALAELWQKVWGFLLEVGHAVGRLFMAAWEWLQEVGGKLAEGFKEAWNKLKELAEPLINAFKEAWDKLKEFGEELVGKFKEAFDKIKDTVKDLADKVVGPLKESGGKAAQSFKNGIENAGEMFSKMGGKIWDGLKNGLAGLGTVIKEQLDKLNPSAIFDKIFRIPESAWKDRGPVEKALGINVPFLGFASGGIVPGTAKVPGNSEMNDKVIAMVSPGEAFIDRKKMQNPLIKSIIENILNGKFDPKKYAEGGIVGKAVRHVSGVVGGNIQNVMDTLDPAKLWEGVRARINDMVWKMFEANKFHDGGPVPMDMGASLQGGEFVMSRRGVQAAGLGALQAINGGAATSAPVITNNIELKITVNADSFDDAYVRNKLMPTIRQELRKASQKGDPLISIRGVYDA